MCYASTLKNIHQNRFISVGNFPIVFAYCRDFEAPRPWGAAAVPPGCQQSEQKMSRQNHSLSLSP